MIDKNRNMAGADAETIKKKAAGEPQVSKCASSADPKAIDCVADDEEYWEEMLFLSRGPRKWNIGCGCG